MSQNCDHLEHLLLDLIDTIDTMFVDQITMVTKIGNEHPRTQTFSHSRTHSFSSEQRVLLLRMRENHITLRDQIADILNQLRVQPQNGRKIYKLDAEQDRLKNIRPRQDAEDGKNKKNCGDKRKMSSKPVKNTLRIENDCPFCVHFLSVGSSKIEKAEDFMHSSCTENDGDNENGGDNGDNGDNDPRGKETAGKSRIYNSEINLRYERLRPLVHQKSSTSKNSGENDGDKDDNNGDKVDNNGENNSEHSRCNVPIHCGSRYDGVNTAKFNDEDNLVEDDGDNFDGSRYYCGDNESSGDLDGFVLVEDEMSIRVVENSNAENSQYFLPYRLGVILYLRTKIIHLRLLGFSKIIKELKLLKSN